MGYGNPLNLPASADATLNQKLGVF